MTNKNKIVLLYLKNINITSTLGPKSETSNATTYEIGDECKYFVKGLMNDPANSYLAYLFTSDKSLYPETFGVFKLDFTPSSLKYVYTTLSMSTG